jgi:hypothetical protein
MKTDQLFFFFYKNTQFINFCCFFIEMPMLLFFTNLHKNYKLVDRKKKIFNHSLNSLKISLVHHLVFVLKKKILPLNYDNKNLQARKMDD